MERTLSPRSGRPEIAQQFTGKGEATMIGVRETDDCKLTGLHHLRQNLHCPLHFFIRIEEMRRHA